MEFLKSISKRRTLLSETIYIALNIGLALGLMFFTRYTKSLVPGIIIVFLSHWRVFAVRARFWVANVKANALSYVVSFSYVIFLFVVNPGQADSDVLPSLITQIVLAVLFMAWIIFLKPKSKKGFVLAQSGVALFAGITALYTVSYGWIATPVVLFVWLVSYISAKHILSTYDEGHDILLSLAFGLVMAEIGWLAHHWVVAYRIPFLPDFMIPQVSIIMLATGFLAFKVYDSFHQYKKVKLNEIILPLLFAVGLVGVLVLFRNGIEQTIY